MQDNLNKLAMIAITSAYFSLLILKVQAQPVVQPQVVEITYNKTTSLVFPGIIKAVDRGSRDLLAQKAKGVENVLQLKAARQGFPQTNLTVITADGQIREFTVAYSKEPGCLVLKIGMPKEALNDSVKDLIFRTDLTESDMERYATRILKTKRTVRFCREGKFKMGIMLKGIYIRGNVVFYRFQIKNRSNVGYDVDYLRFFIDDRARVKRTASQELDINPLFVYGNDSHIPGKSTQEVVYALQKFTIPDAKRLVVEMFEQNGGRNLNLHVRNSTIVNARAIK